MAKEILFKKARYVNDGVRVYRTPYELSINVGDACFTIQDAEHGPMWAARSIRDQLSKAIEEYDAEEAARVKKKEEDRNAAIDQIANEICRAFAMRPDQCREIASAIALGKIKSVKSAALMDRNLDIFDFFNGIFKQPATKNESKQDESKQTASGA